MTTASVLSFCWFCWWMHWKQRGLNEMAGILETTFSNAALSGEMVIFSWWRHQTEAIPRYWTFVRVIHRLAVNSPHKGQWRGPLMFSLIYAWTNGWVNNRDASGLRCHRAHYDSAEIHFKISQHCFGQWLGAVMWQALPKPMLTKVQITMWGH